MSVSRKLTPHWLLALALALASLLIVRPLHEARHLAEPLARATTFVDAAQPGSDREASADDLSAVNDALDADEGTDREQRLGACVWCLLHGHAAQVGFHLPTLPLLPASRHAQPLAPPWRAPVLPRLPIPPPRGPPVIA